MAKPGLILRRGNRGEGVRQLQRQLIAAGFDVGPAGADGVFGPATERAVRAFQQSAGLQVDGRAGGDTKDALMPTPRARPGSAPAGMEIAPEQAAIAQALMASEVPAAMAPEVQAEPALSSPGGMQAPIGVRSQSIDPAQLQGMPALSATGFPGGPQVGRSRIGEAGPPMRPPGARTRRAPVSEEQRARELVASLLGGR